jgi:uncharacterized protein (TIGR00369 family)
MSTAALERTTGGVEFLQRLISAEVRLPIGEMLGFRLVEAEKGRVALVGRPDKRSYNLIGSVHGGWAATIIDSALALSTLSTLDPDQTFTTIDLRVNYLRPLTEETGEVRCEGRVLQGGRRLVYAEASLTDANGKLISHGTGSCLILAR